MGVKILSLYDGMACGMIAMQLAGVEVESYDAYEIDKYAIKTAQHNFPMIKEHGDVFDADFTQYEDVDFGIGGSPCTHWSIAQTKNRETTVNRDSKGNVLLHQSGIGVELFSQFLRMLSEAKPKFFIYENNKSISKEIRTAITECFGFEPTEINSALVSAQNRQRLYWVGKRNEDGTYSKVNVEQPEDRGILLRDVLETGVAWNEKAYNLTTRCCGAVPEDTLKRHRHTMVAEPVRGMENDTKSRTLTANYWKTNVRDAFVDCAGGRTMAAEPVACRCRGRVDASGNGYAKYECREDGKSNTLDTNTTNRAMVAEPINVTADGKAQCLRATCYKDGIRNIIANEVDNKTGVAEPINVPRDCDVVITENSIRCQRRDQKHSTVQGSHVNFTDGKTQTLSPSHIPNVIEPKSRGDLYAIPTMPVKEATAKGYTEIECGDCVDLSMPNSKTRRGRSMADKSNCMQTSNDFYQYVGYVIEFDDDGRPIKAIGKDGKEITIYEVKDGNITIKGKQYPIKLKDGYYIIRKLTVSECKRLQTVPEWYEFPVSNSQAYKMLGNGWTCEVICHLINSCFKPADVLPGQIGLW